MCDSSFYSILITHFYQCCAWNSLHKFYLFNISVQAEQVEDPRTVHL